MTEPLLRMSGVRAYYDGVEALHGIDITVDTGEVVVILGANGAGKTTTLRSICQLTTTTGEIRFDGDLISGASTSSIVRRGIAMVPQGRGTLGDLSVEDNLLAGAVTRRDKGVADDIASWYETFPRLAQRRHQTAGSLSGGEQQMLAIARALMLRPRLLLMDEPSLGLAPVIVRDLFDVLARINRERGVAIVLVEQNAVLALDIAQRGYVLEAGNLVLSASADQLRQDDAVRLAYLGN
ncbi:ABC transporter ATP-binding protein [Nonomuraea sp. NPDC050478]|uniref:ABC transporter ATP-binding protein n=1 Tax=Nonomuraea sp. NPDC050478 TaxID=3364365 RepID=UPI0037B52988